MTSFVFTSLSFLNIVLSLLCPAPKWICSFNKEKQVKTNMVPRGWWYMQHSERQNCSVLCLFPLGRVKAVFYSSPIWCKIPIPEFHSEWWPFTLCSPPSRFVVSCPPLHLWLSFTYCLLFSECKLLDSIGLSYLLVFVSLELSTRHMVFNKCLSFIHPSTHLSWYILKVSL